MSLLLRSHFKQKYLLYQLIQLQGLEVGFECSTEKREQNVLV